MIRQIEVTDGGTALQVLEGRYGPYVTDGETNASVPRGTDPATLTLERGARAARGAPRRAAARQPPRPARRRRDAAAARAPGRPPRGGRRRRPARRTAAAKRETEARSRKTRRTDAVRIIGGGLAGCEAAWQAASRGVPVTLYEMRPVRADRRPQDRSPRRAGLQQLVSRRQAR